MLRKILALSLVIGLLLSGCAGAGKPTKYQRTYWEAFDTVTEITGYAESQAAFDQMADLICEELYRYHQLFDIYNDYPGVQNLKTINDQAGIAPVQVDAAILALLLDCRAYYQATGGLVNAAMGSVLRIWHAARNASQAVLPDRQALEEAAQHTAWDAVIIDEANSTVFLADPAMSLDVGAIAKGWATQRVAEQVPSGWLLSVGSNICATGPKPNGDAWRIGVQDPDNPNGYLLAMELHRGAAVTSGDYQRFYTVDGVDYHHIIDPNTLYPATYWRSVTVLCSDSAVADLLSTALFLLPMEEGKVLASTFGAEAMWVDAQGNQFFTDGFAR